MKKFIIPIILIGIAVLIISLGIIYPSKKVLDTRYDNKIYCSSTGMCYIYDGKNLKKYEDDDDSEDTYLDILYSSCIYTERINNCKEEPIFWDEKVLYIKTNTNSKVFIDGYYNVDIEKGKSKSIDLTGKAFQNEKLDLFFISNGQVIVSGKKKSQEKCNYYISAYDMDQYTSIRYVCPSKYDEEDNYNTYSYEIKNEKISNFNRATKEKLTHINFSYYDKEYNYLPKTFKDIDGHYIMDNNQDSYEEAWINGNSLRIKTNLLDNSITIAIQEYNKEYFLFDDTINGYYYYYDLKEDTLCRAGVCLKKIE